MRSLYVRKILLFLIVCTVVHGSSQAQAPSDFFPSQVGNLWQYFGTISPMERSIVGDSISSNGERFLFIAGRPFLYRLDTLFNVYRISSNGNEYHPYKLDADSGETWVWYRGSASGDNWAWVSGVHSSIVFGIPTTVKVFRFGPEHPDSVGGDWYMVEEHLASGFGVIYRWEEPGEVSYLQGCVIAGDTFGFVVSVPEDANEIPGTAQLFQNYPNPFNSATTIEYHISQDGLVRLRVFDILGREITTLVEAAQQSGEYRVPFDATGLPSGIYLYKIETTSGVKRKQMLLMK